MKDGYVKLFRQSLDSAVFTNANLWQVWCWCLMKANHDERKMLWNGEEITINPGQFLCGRFSGAKECHMKPSTFRNQLALLKKLENLDISSDSGSSLITIVKWPEYQGNGSLPNEIRTGRRTPEGQPKDTNKNIFIEQILPRDLAKELILRKFETKETFTLIPKSDPPKVRYRGYKNPWRELQKLGLVKGRTHETG